MCRFRKCVPKWRYCAKALHQRHFRFNTHHRAVLEQQHGIAAILLTIRICWQICGFACGVSFAWTVAHTHMAVTFNVPRPSGAPRQVTHEGAVGPRPLPANVGLSPIRVSLGRLLLDRQLITESEL